LNSCLCQVAGNQLSVMFVLLCIDQEDVIGCQCLMLVGSCIVVWGYEVDGLSVVVCCRLLLLCA